MNACNSVRRRPTISVTLSPLIDKLRSPPSSSSSVLASSSSALPFSLPSFHPSSGVFSFGSYGENSLCPPRLIINYSALHSSILVVADASPLSLIICEQVKNSSFFTTLVDSASILGFLFKRRSPRDYTAFRKRKQHLDLFGVGPFADRRGTRKEEREISLQIFRRISKGPFRKLHWFCNTQR